MGLHLTELFWSYDEPAPDSATFRKITPEEYQELRAPVANRMKMIPITLSVGANDYHKVVLYTTEVNGDGSKRVFIKILPSFLPSRAVGFEQLGLTIWTSDTYIDPNHFCRLFGDVIEDSDEDNMVFRATKYKYVGWRDELNSLGEVVPERLPYIRQ